jgi:4-amino-4-deoxy-L-arabinose transferase-like glycosyltransferase
MFSLGRLSPTARNILVLLAVCAVAAALKLYFFGTTHSGDYDTYVNAAQTIAGTYTPPPGALWYNVPERLIKPLAPATLALLHAAGFSYFGAALAQALFFYAAFIAAMYLLAKEFFEDEHLAVYAVLLTALSYPLLKYGIDALIETGALFFYVLALWLALRFAKQPNWPRLLLAVASVIVGFLWKEYSAVAGAALGLAILFHGALSWRQKFSYIAAYAGLFIIVMVPWLLFIFHAFGFTYLQWWKLGGQSGFGYQFTLVNLFKSTAGVIGIMWLLVPLGLRKWHGFSSVQKRFLSVSAPPTLIVYGWGYVSSRLFYVMAPPFLFLSLAGMRGWSVRAQNTFVALAVLANLTWLFLSFHVSL